MALHEEKKVVVRCERVGAYNRICYPVCHRATLFCRLAGCDFLTDDQMKIVELIGFTIECEPQNNGD